MNDSREIESPATPPDGFAASCERIGVALEPSTVQAIGRYLALLLDANRRTNLTAVRDAATAWERHALDSLSVLPFLGTPHTLIDVGTGGGLPGIPIAIARPEIEVTLLEATGKKADFCEHAARELGLDNVRVLRGRAEELGRDPAHREAYDAATVRAVAALPVLLELMMPFVRPGGAALAMKGARSDEELDAATYAVRVLGGSPARCEARLPGIRDDATMIVVEKAGATPDTYPRRTGIPVKRPLEERS